MELNIEVVVVLVVRIEGNYVVVEVFVVLVGVGVVAVVVEHVQSENNILYFILWSDSTIHVSSYVWLLWLLLLWLLIFVVFRNLLTIFICCFVDKGWWSYCYTFA